MSVERIVVAVVIVVCGVAAASLVDRVLKRRRDLPPASLTRYRAIRRTIYVLILIVTAALAALTFPTVRGAAGAILSSAAVLGAGR